MPFYFSRSDLNKQYTQLQLEKHIAEIWRYNGLLFRLNKELENLRDKVLRDYNSLVTERDERHKVFANSVEDSNRGYAWTPAYKVTIGTDYKSYNDNMHKIISEFIKIYREFTLLLTEFQIRELELESPELESPKIALLRETAETIKKTIGNYIAPIEEDEKALFDNIEQLKSIYKQYLRSGYINLQFIYNELHPGVAVSREVHNMIHLEGRKLIDNLKGQRKAIDRKASEFFNSRLDVVEEMYRFYQATDEVWKNAMKQRDSTEATRIFKEGMDRIRKLEEDKRKLQEGIASAKGNPEAEAREAEGMATVGQAVVATVGDDTAAVVDTTAEAGREAPENEDEK